jgi:hypothetical protein
MAEELLARAWSFERCLPQDDIKTIAFKEKTVSAKSERVSYRTDVRPCSCDDRISAPVELSGAGVERPRE